LQAEAAIATKCSELTLAPLAGLDTETWADDVAASTKSTGTEKQRVFMESLLGAGVGGGSGQPLSFFAVRGQEVTSLLTYDRASRYFLFTSLHRPDPAVFFKEGFA
jgi:hypothetical protein